MSPLKKKLLHYIQSNGPMSVEKYMDLCLYDPDHGYYRVRNGIGTIGDFVTSPELSQLFGELIGLWLAQVWVDQGKRQPFALVELGPGRGTLMSDILKSTSVVPHFNKAASIFLIEISEKLKKVQQQCLSKHTITWLKSIEELPEIPIFAIGNEFLDALPVRQFKRTNGVWKERCVSLDSNFNLFYCYVPSSFHTELQFLHGNVPDNEVIEVCDKAKGFISKFSNKILKNSGCALFIDYAHFGQLGDTFQAVRNHSFVDPLKNLGESDLTCHVDFKTITDAAQFNGLRASKILTQRDFLLNLGIEKRVNSLVRNLNEKEKHSIILAKNRLINKDGMGDLFKVVGITPKTAPDLPILGKI